jgi:hypothetical protein
MIRILILVAMALLALAGCSASTKNPASHAPAAPVPTVASPTSTPTSATTAPTATRKAMAAVTTRKMPKRAYTCEPQADAKFFPGTNIVRNKACPRINKERAEANQAFVKCPSSWDVKRQRCKTSGELQAEYLDAEAESHLRICQKQTGMTRKECLADAAAGNAN